MTLCVKTHVLAFFLESTEPIIVSCQSPSLTSTIFELQLFILLQVYDSLGLLRLLLCSLFLLVAASSHQFLLHKDESREKEEKTIPSRKHDIICGSENYQYVTPVCDSLARQYIFLSTYNYVRPYSILRNKKCKSQEEKKKGIFYSDDRNSIKFDCWYCLRTETLVEKSSSKQTIEDKFISIHSSVSN